MTPRKCIRGYGCGDTCIARTDACQSAIGDPMMIAALAGLVMKTAYALKNNKSRIAADKASVAEAIGKAKAIADPQLREDKMYSIAMQTLNTIPPDEAAEILLDIHIPSENGEQISLKDYAEGLKQKHTSFAEGKKGASRIPPKGDIVRDELTGKDVHAMYYMPASKIRTVSDEEVDEVYEKLKGDSSELLEGLFKPGRGQPSRYAPPDRKLADWPGKDGQLRLKKSMLKAMLEQIGEDKNGNAYLHDPWEPDGVLKTWPDLDHIVPLAVGGTHGPNVDQDPAPDIGYHSDNFVWIGRHINQNYKAERTIPDTATKLNTDGITEQQYAEYKAAGKDWDATTAKEAMDKAWAKFDEQVQAQLIKKASDADAYALAQKLKDVHSPSFPKKEELQLALQDAKTPKAKDSLLKRMAEGLEAHIDKASIKAEIAKGKSEYPKLMQIFSDKLDELHAKREADLQKLINRA